MSSSKPRKINKSKAIREALAQHPAAKAKEIVELLKGQGLNVHPAMIYMQKSKMLHTKRKKKRAAYSDLSQRISSKNPVELVVRVKQIADEVGGIKNLKQLVDLLAE